MVNAALLNPGGLLNQKPYIHQKDIRGAPAVLIGPWDVVSRLKVIKRLDSLDQGLGIY